MIDTRTRLSHKLLLALIYIYILLGVRYTSAVRASIIIRQNPLQYHMDRFQI